MHPYSGTFGHIVREQTQANRARRATDIQLPHKNALEVSKKETTEKVM